MGPKIEQVKEFFVKYAEIFNVLALGMFCYIFLFAGLGSYPLIDTDETRYVQIAREMFNSGNCITPFLNFVPFLEKPPLYFWLSAISFEIFGPHSIFAARFANAAMGMFIVFFTYFFGRKTFGKTYGIVSALILLTSVWFLLLSHIAILDLGFMATSAASIYCALLSNFCKVERNKKVCWWFFWIFMGVAVLSKGLIGVAIPFGAVFLIAFFTKTLKEFFKPLHILPGILAFVMVVIPWHYMVWTQNGQAWVDMYIIKHHFARFINSGLGLGRKQPFLFYVPVLLIGFLPWVGSLCSFLVRLIKNIIKDLKATKTPMVIFTTDTPAQKILVYSGIWAIFGFLFFSISSTKLPTYILTIFPALALFCGFYWSSYIASDKYSRGIKISSCIISGMFLLAGIIAIALSFINVQVLEVYLTGMDKTLVCGGVFFVVISLLSIFFALKNKRTLLFASFVTLMFGVLALAQLKVFPMMTNYGQSELESFASIAEDDAKSTLATFDFPEKYSVLNVYEKEVKYIHRGNFKALKRTTNANVGHTYVIVKNEIYKKDSFKGFETVKAGKKYTLLRK